MPRHKLALLHSHLGERRVQSPGARYGTTRLSCLDTQQQQRKDQSLTERSQCCLALLLVCRYWDWCGAGPVRCIGVPGGARITGPSLLGCSWHWQWHWPTQNTYLTDPDLLNCVQQRIGLGKVIAESNLCIIQFCYRYRYRYRYRYCYLGPARGNHSTFTLCLHIFLGSNYCARERLKETKDSNANGLFSFSFPIISHHAITPALFSIHTLFRLNFVTCRTPISIRTLPILNLQST